VITGPLDALEFGENMVRGEKIASKLGDLWGHIQGVSGEKQPYPMLSNGDKRTTGE